jgi:hypothetical protein
MDKHETEVMEGYISALQKVANVPKFKEQFEKITGQKSTQAPISNPISPPQTQTLTNDMNQTPPIEAPFKASSIKEAREMSRKIKLWED